MTTDAEKIRIATFAAVPSPFNVEASRAAAIAAGEVIASGGTQEEATEAAKLAAKTPSAYKLPTTTTVAPTPAPTPTTSTSISPTPQITPSYQQAQTLLSPYITQNTQTNIQTIDVQKAVQNLHPSDVQSALVNLQVPNAHKLVQQAQTHLSDQKILEKYKDKDGVNLIKLYKDVYTYPDRATKLKEAAARNFKSEDIKAAKYLALPVVSEKIYKKMTPEQQKMHRFTGTISAEKWAKLPVYMRGDFTPETTAGVYAKLSPEMQKRTAVKLTQWQSVTPWREEKGEKATTARALLWTADIAVPFVHAARHWGQMNNWERGLSLGLDAVFVGALTYKPVSSLVKSAASTLGKSQQRILLKDLKALNSAVKAQSVDRIRDAGRNLAELGASIRGHKGTMIAQRGRYAEQYAESIASMPRATQNNLRRHISQFIKDQRGGLERYKIKPEALRTKPKVQTIPITREELAKKGVTSGQAEQLLKKAGGHEATFRQLVDKQAGKNKRMWKMIEDRFESETRISQAMRKHGLRRPEAPAPKTKPESITRLEALTRWRENLKNMDSPASRDLLKKTRQAIRNEKAKVKLAPKKAKELVDKAKENENAIKAAAEKALKEVELLMGEGRLALINQMLRGLTKAQANALVAVNAKLLAQILAKADTKTKAKVLSKLQPTVQTSLKEATATKTAIDLKLANKAQIAAKTELGLATGTMAKVRKDKEIVIVPTTKLVDFTPVPKPPVSPPVTPPKPPTTPPPTPPTKKPPPTKRPPPIPPKIAIRRVIGRPKPEEAGPITWDDGITRITVKPPYRLGSKDIKYDPLDPPRKGKGSQERTLRVLGGKKAPKLVEMSQGLNPITIRNGKRMTHGMSDVIKHRGPGLLNKKGKLIRQRRGSVI